MEVSASLDLKVVEDLKKRGVALHLLDLGGDISGNGLSKLFLTIAAAFAEAERDRIRERIGQVKADQKAKGRYLGGKVPFGYRRGESGELVPHEAEQEAIREIVSLRAQGKALRAIAEVVAAKGHQISHEGVAELAFTSETLILSFSMPNFYFHVVTAYDILRMRGVPIGKRDYEGRLRTRSY